MAISISFRNFFSHRKITLSKALKDYLILGGNHRIRLLSEGLNDCLIILKLGENHNFIKNDIYVRSNNYITYAPKIIDSGNDWLREEYFNGTPFNRVDKTRDLNKLKNKIIENHTEELIYPTIEKVTYRYYKENIETEIKRVLENKNIIISREVSSSLKKVFQILFERISKCKIDVSWSHGDFQESNILVSKSNYKVIDWEASNKRYYLYDEFVLLSRIRTKISLKEAIVNFKSNTLKDLEKENVEDTIVLLLIEELRFYLYEEFSVNFYSSGKKTKPLCDAIEKFINEK